MPKNIDEQELDIIEKILEEHPEGVGIASLLRGLADIGLNINRRTLFRRLENLIKQNRIIATGKQKGRIYQTFTSKQAASVVSDQILIPLSEAGQEVRAYVTRPIQKREPVGYKRDFLLSYKQKGRYLDDNILEHLYSIGRPHQEALPAGTIARQIMGRLLIDLSWASSSLEGNTYSLLDTERLISFGQAAEGKNALETQMILNHKQAIEFLVESADEIGLNRYTILNLHAILSDNLLPNPEACGRLRQIAVGIGGSVYTPLATPQLLDEYFQRFLDIAASIKEPFEQSFFILVHLSYLQAFEDVNKRVARLSANIPFIKYNLCPLSFIDVPKSTYVEGVLGVYELNRIELLRDVFVWGYERSVKRYTAAREEIGEPNPFRLRYRGELKEVVYEIVKHVVQDATNFTKEWMEERIPKDDAAQFLEMVDIELNGLHEGNIGRYRILPSEFISWQKMKAEQP